MGVVARQIWAYDTDADLAHADAAVVLGAAVWGDRPSPVFRERIDHAIRLYQQGVIDSIIFTGGQGDAGELAEALVARQVALARGVPGADILTETQSWTTWQNLTYAHRVASDAGLERFLIVSDPLHMKRAVLMARDLGMDAYPSPTPTTMYRSRRSQLRFLARETYFYLIYLVSRPIRVGMAGSRIDVTAQASRLSNTSAPKREEMGMLRAALPLSTSPLFPFSRARRATARHS